MINLFKLFRKNKKQTITFYSICPEVATIAPVLSATKFRPEVMLNATKEYATKKQEPDFGTKHYTSLAKCPGIYDYARQGWVITAWQDIVIETNGDGSTYTWSTPLDQNSLTNGELVGETVSFHGKYEYADYTSPNPHALDCVIKINTPWRVIIPEGYYLKEGPLPHSNERRFTVIEGVFDADYQYATLNIQLFWHVMNGKTLIKAGTPIAHYYLIPKDQPELVVTSATPEQILAEKTVKTAIQSGYITDVKRNKCVMHNIIKGLRDGSKK
jgi:hypothetical protein